LLYPLASIMLNMNEGKKYFQTKNTMTGHTVSKMEEENKIKSVRTSLSLWLLSLNSPITHSGGDKPLACFRMVS
jgi:hypothetical protein